jgi:hypothetical protein
MGLYSNSAFGPPYKEVRRMGTNTEPNYLFGEFDFDTQPFLFNVTQVSLTSNVASVTGTLISGGGGKGPSPYAAPSVGAKCGVRGTQTNGGVFNVDPATVTAVNWNPATGQATISFALTNANVGATPDTGMMVVNPYEVPDGPLALNLTSRPIALIYTPDESDNSRCLFAECKFTGTLPTSATVVLQVANVDDDARYQTVGTIATVAGRAVTQAGAEFSFLMGKFIRMKVTDLSGGDSTSGIVGTVFG